jgi:TonB family protein
LITTIKKRVFLVSLICACAIMCAVFAANTLGRAQQGAPEQSNKTKHEPDGIQILTPHEGVDFTTFESDMQQAIHRNWYATMPEEVKKGSKGRVVVRFKVQRDGTLVDRVPTVETSSGNDALDSAAIAAIRASTPFEHMPDSFKGPYIELRLDFYYNIPMPGHHS